MDCAIYSGPLTSATPSHTVYLRYVNAYSSVESRSRGNGSVKIAIYLVARNEFYRNVRTNAIMRDAKTRIFCIIIIL